MLLNMLKCFRETEDYTITENTIPFINTSFGGGKIRYNYSYN